MPNLSTVSGVYSPIGAKRRVPVVTGGTIVNSGGYRYHVFTGIGNLEVNGPVPSAEVLMVAGGGGSGQDRSGGGGGGGVRLVSTTLPMGKHLVSVGAGGAGGVVGVSNGSNGSNSSLIYNASRNEILNGSFETNITPWETYNGNSIARTTSEAFVGAASLQVTSANSSVTDIYQNFAKTDFSIGENFTASAYFKAGTAGRTCYMAIYLGMSSGPAVSFFSPVITPNSSNWTRAQVTFQIPSGAVSIYVNIQFTAGATGTTFVDGVQLERGTTATSYVDPGNSGTESAVGGGFGGGWQQTGNSGGSGGGGGCADTAAIFGGAGTSGQGFAGGRNFAQSGFFPTGGGGGGAGAAGANGTSTTMGAGGIGTNTFSVWASATNTGVSGRYAGGGSGGCDSRNTSTPASVAGGLGGGGTGFKTAAGGAGVINTGGGGGGAGIQFNPLVQRNGGPGGSGLVIIRYPI